MKSEIIEHPVFASRFIKQFIHYDQIDELLLSNLEWDVENKTFAISLLPLTDNIPESRRLIVRIFVANLTSENQKITVFYSVSTFYSDLQRLEKLRKIGTITLEPKSVYFRDVSYKDYQKRQGKHYFQITIAKKGFHKKIKKQKAKKEESKDAILSAYLSYTRLREIKEFLQLERTNYLGLNSKPYVNPLSLKYWLYYSIFGPYTYRDEGPFVQILKGILIVGGIVGILFNQFENTITLPWIMPVSIASITTGLLSLFSNRDKTTIELAKELKLTPYKRKATLNGATMQLDNSMLAKYCATDMHYYYNRETGEIHWKKGANRKYQYLIIEIAKSLGIKLEIKEEFEIRTEERRKKETKKKTKEIARGETEKTEKNGIDLRSEEGISFSDGIKGVNVPKEGIVHVDTKPLTADTQVLPNAKPVNSIGVIDDTDTVIKSGETRIHTLDKAIITDSSISFESIPKPPYITKKEEPTKKSVKNKNKK